MKLIARVLFTEIIKARNSVALWLTLIFPLGSVFLASILLYASRNNVSPNMMVFINNFNGLVAFLLPFYVVLMVSFYCQMEHRNNMLKFLYSQPLPRWSFYYGKLAALLLFMLATWLLLLVFTYFSFFILGLLSEKLRITGQFEHGYLLRVTTRSYLSALAMLVTQYLLGMKLRNVVASVSIGISLIIIPIAIIIVLGITGVITNPDILKWLPVYNPYSYPYSFVFHFSQGGSIRQDFYSLSLVLWTSFAVVASLLGYYELKFRNIK